jgi:hypothetical protein
VVVPTVNKGLFRFQWGAVDRIEGGLMVVGQVTPPA